MNRMLAVLTPALKMPIFVTQHLPASFVSVFARQLEAISGRRTVIGEDGTEVNNGEIIVATGHGHLLVRRVGDRLVTQISAEPATSGCMPSVDPMISSLCHAYDGQVLAIVLSGMGRDGLHGSQELAACGGTIFAQDAATSAVWGMPGAVAKEGPASLVAAPEKLGEVIMSHVPVMHVN